MKTNFGDEVRSMAADNNGLQIAHRFAFGEAVSELPPGAGEWLRAGLRRFLRGDSPSLEVALSLTGGSRIAARNRALRDAAAALDPDLTLSDWELSGRLECAIRRFESVSLVQINRGHLRGVAARRATAGDLDPADVQEDELTVGEAAGHAPSATGHAAG
jgi:hypothetical protein